MEPQTREYVLDAEQERRLAERVKEARDYLGLSQEFVADRIGISRPAMSALETGKRKISSIELHKLARLLKKPLEYFFDDDEVLAGPQDETAQALYRASKGLSEQDKQQVLRFAEFLRQAGRAPALTSTDQS
ncbi:helix-turn-helix transcriptional regulator [Deinococcus aestuarii]|uniref:helix-turn-helix transcriptional regulator n=1 Tax=Deinococcus aestuarii TaxID=2774531 RepID=UPI001C0D0C8D|nr:helix-turn-helix transcriptional regulator [Deinococcus aestuarii]